MSGINSIVLVSGGMDSCVTAAIALRDLESNAPGEQARDRAGFLHVNYGQRTAEREHRAFNQIADFYGIRSRMVADIQHLKAIGGSALTDPEIEVPARLVLSADEPQARASSGANVLERISTSEIPVTYVPFRNTHLLAIAVSWAEVVGAERIYIGAVAEDSSGYPDCRAEYYRAFNELIRVGTRPQTRLQVVTPVIDMRKSEIVERGRQLGAPFHLTWSCYQKQDIGCGVCDSCVLRRRAFEQAGFQDPIPYLNTSRWQEPLRAGSG